MINWINSNKSTIIRIAFLIPIILVAIISISHVISWYKLANPISWAIYLSIAIEIAAMSSIAAASVKVKGFSVWFVFIIVTLIQFIGNIYFSFAEIDITSNEFKDWVDLTKPIFELMGSDQTDLLAQRRWLAILEGGLLPLISLTCLHFFIQYNDSSSSKPTKNIVSDSLEDSKQISSSFSALSELVGIDKNVEIPEPETVEIVNDSIIENNINEEIDITKQEEPTIDYAVPIEKSEIEETAISFENKDEITTEEQEDFKKKIN